MATMPSVEVLRKDIEARSTWKMNISYIEEGSDLAAFFGFSHSAVFLDLRRRVVDGPYRGKKVAVSVFPRAYFNSGVDYEAALARLLADAEASYAKLLEGGEAQASGADDRDANTAA